MFGTVNYGTVICLYFYVRYIQIYAICILVSSLSSNSHWHYLKLSSFCFYYTFKLPLSANTNNIFIKNSIFTLEQPIFSYKKLAKTWLGYLPIPTCIAKG